MLCILVLVTCVCEPPHTHTYTYWPAIVDGAHTIVCGDVGQ